MVSFIRRYWVEASVVAFVLAMVPVAWSMSANRQVAYAPCLVKVLAALRDDPAAAKLSKLDDTAELPTTEPCAAAADAARDANRAIGELLLADKTLFRRLPKLLKQSGMACLSGPVSIACNCRASGPFVIANPGAYCTSLVSLPVPFERGLFVDVSIHPSHRHGKTVKFGRFIVEMSYDSGFVDFSRAVPVAPQPEPAGTLEAWIGQ